MELLLHLLPFLPQLTDAPETPGMPIPKETYRPPLRVLGDPTREGRFSLLCVPSKTFSSMKVAGASRCDWCVPGGPSRGRRPSAVALLGALLVGRIPGRGEGLALPGALCSGVEHRAP